MLKLTLLLVAGSFSDVSCARILASFITSSYSHQIVYQPIWRELALRGHDITVVTPNPLRENITGLREIDVSVESYKIWDKQHDFSGPIDKNTGHHLHVAIIETFHMLSKLQLSHSEVQKMIKNKTEHFDLVLIELIYPMPGILSWVFRCPLIGISSIGSIFHTNIHIGNPSHPVLFPDFSLPYFGQMNFFQRVANTALHVMWRLFYYGYVLPTKNKDLREIIEDAPDIQHVLDDMSMAFFYRNRVLDHRRPIIPSIIEFSGTHLRKPKELPENLRSYLNNATDGAIYFSLGSNVKTKFLQKYCIDIFLEVFEELPYKVLWKLDMPLSRDLPSNVITSKWFPQQDILSHPNIRLFITQGGLQSLEEAIQNKIPMLGIPFFGDQPVNIQKMVDAGLGLSISIDDITKEEFRGKIQEIITTKKYKNKIEEASRIQGDEPERAVDKLVWWIEYVIRHKGAKHLKSSYGSTEWYKYLMLDVIVFLLALAAIFIYVCVKTITCLSNLLRKRPKEKQN